MVSSTAFKQPSDVDAENGEVVVDGPGGIAYGMTPDAASETGDRLNRAATRARTQEAKAP